MLVLIFLSAFVIASHQEFRLQLERPIYWFPYRSPSSQEIPHRQVVPFQYPDQANLFGNTFTQHPTPQQSPPDFASGTDWQDRINSNNQKNKETPAEGRTTVSDADAELRFYHNYWKTATFTLTTTLNITRVWSCLPVSLFWGNSYSTPCSRKKREITKDFLEIEPSEPQLVTMTTVPVVADKLERRNHPLVYDRDLISSSKDDVIVRDETTHGENDLKKKKQKRFIFHHWVTFTTATSFVFHTFYVTKRASPAGNGAFYCRPTDYPLCM